MCSHTRVCVCVCVRACVCICIGDMGLQLGSTGVTQDVSTRKIQRPPDAGVGYQGGRCAPGGSTCVPPLHSGRLAYEHTLTTCCSRPV